MGKVPCELGLEEYIEKFDDERITPNNISYVTENDLKNLVPKVDDRAAINGWCSRQKPEKGMLFWTVSSGNGVRLKN